MYKCVTCGFKTEEPEITYDEYDCSSYPVCGECGGMLIEKTAECKYCCADLFEGERIYKVGIDYFCKKCVKELIA